MSQFLLWLILTHPGSGHDLLEVEGQLVEEPERIDLQVERALAHWRMGRMGPAAEIVQEFRIHEGWPTEGVWLEGMLALDAGDNALAESRLRAYLSAGGTRTSALSSLAKSVQNQKRWEEAGHLYMEALAHSRNPDDAIKAAKMASRAGQHRLARERISAAIEELGQAVSLRTARVDILVDAGEFDLALEELESLLEMAPHHTGWKERRLELIQKISEEKQ